LSGGGRRPSVEAQAGERQEDSFYRAGKIQTPATTLPVEGEGDLATPDKRKRRTLRPKGGDGNMSPRSMTAGKSQGAMKGEKERKREARAYRKRNHVFEAARRKGLPSRREKEREKGEENESGSTSSPPEVFSGGKKVVGPRSKRDRKKRKSPCPRAHRRRNRIPFRGNSS